MPPCEGGWLREDDTIIWENPVLVYTYVKPENFEQLLPQLRDFLHRMGRETDQGEVAVEFENRFYRIHTFNS